MSSGLTIAFKQSLKRPSFMVVLLVLLLAPPASSGEALKLPGRSAPPPIDERLVVDGIAERVTEGVDDPARIAVPDG